MLVCHCRDEDEFVLRHNALMGLYAFAFGVLAGLLAFPSARQALFDPAPDRVTGRANVGGPFSLLDHRGRRVTDRSFRGKPMLVVFGYTRSADIVPATLQTISAALDRLGGGADKIAPLLITIDPDFDTPQVLQTYLARFHPAVTALTGSPHEIDAVAQAYRVRSQRLSNSDGAAAFGLDHTSLLYLMDRSGNFITFMTYDVTVDALLRELRNVL